ncbi:putative cystathionine beta-lyase [uncultured Gammaproteobacteria bacterium]
MTEIFPDRLLRPETLLTHGGNDPFSHQGIVNPPVYHASTVVFPTLEALEAIDRAPFDIINYGRIGTPTSRALEDAVAALEGGHRAVTTASGLNAIATALTAFTRAGNHILIADSVYGPTRRFCAEVLAPYGVTVEYYDPLIGAGIGNLIRPQTTLVYLESPGSLTFEVQDVPAIVAGVRAASASSGRRITTMIDNTWATPLYFKPFTHGVDVSLHAATKYLGGHSDIMLGVIVCGTAETFDAVKRAAVRFGTCAGPDDIFLALRGLRTLAVRLERHWRTGLALAEWLEARPEVARVLHPARPNDSGHALWRRDFTGASGLFSILLHPCPKPALAAMLDGLKLFGMGYSWGGYESLILPAKPAGVRSATRWTEPGWLLRLHAGLEAVEDLVADLEAGFSRLGRYS